MEINCCTAFEGQKEHIILNLEKHGYYYKHDTKIHQ